jgi:flagellar protein FlaF
VYENSLKSYHHVEQTTISGRETEARVLTKAAVMLKQCQKNWHAADRRQKLHEALNFNQKIWSWIQGELMNENNPLPKFLKENILSLSVLIDKRIFNVMAYPAPEKLKIIIDINLNLAAGLRESVPTSNQEKFQVS